MDKAFEKLGLYDFFGIWIPGALTVTYYLFTLRDYFYHIFSFLKISQNGIPSYLLIIILYTAVAYIVGVILHEIGKIIADITTIFNFHTINSRIKNLSVSKCPRTNVFKRIQYEYKNSLEKNDIKLENIVDFDKAISYLKYNGRITTKRIDTYHAIYALSRSLSLCFLGHLLLLLFIIIKTSIIAIINTIELWVLVPYAFLCIIDITLLFLFFLRTYRYFHSWIKNIFIQYYKNIYQNQSNQLIW